jgi:hypothetical protein
MRLSMTTAAWPTPKSTPDERASTAAGFWLRSVLFYREHGVTTIKRCLTDNGPAYRSKVFNDSLTHTGTAHKFTRPHTPRTNGKVERFNLTMKVEWLYVRPPASDEERTAALADFLNTYNHERPHSALGEQASGQSGADHDVPPCTAVGELRYAPDRRTRLRAHVVRSAVNNLMRWNS